MDDTLVAEGPVRVEGSLGKSTFGNFRVNVPMPACKPAANNNPPKIIQIAVADASHLYALCDDGSIYLKVELSNWRRISGIEG